MAQCNIYIIFKRHFPYKSPIKKQKSQPFCAMTQIKMTLQKLPSQQVTSVQGQ